MHGMSEVFLATCVVFVCMQVTACISDEELQALLNSPAFDFRFNCGIGETSSTIRISDKDKIVNAMILHFTILATTTELEQMKQGLTIQKFNELMKRHPLIMRTAFQARSNLTCSDIERLYNHNSAELAAVGTDKRERQEAILHAFTKYIHELKGKS